MSNIEHIVSDSEVISLLLNGKSYVVQPDHHFYPRIKQAIKDQDKETLEDLLTNPYAGIAEYKDGSVTWNGKALNNVLVERIKEMIRKNIDTAPMLRFLENVMLNPSEDSRRELYEFLAHKNLPITEDGCFLGYKAIRKDWKDIYSGTVNNSVGKVIQMPRSKVDPNRRNHCSAGYHVGTIDYVKWYGSGNDTRFVIVKVNPMDAVSVPADHNAMKLRCCKYEVIKEIERGNVLDFPVYSSDGLDKYDNIVEFERKEAKEADWDWFEKDTEEEKYVEELIEKADAKKEEVLSSREVFISEETDWYEKEWAEEDLYREVLDRELVPSLETAKMVGLKGCIALIVGQDVREMFG